MLASLIDTLRSKQDKVDTAMIYLSDHGESLGEYNLFLHGTPYAIAPEQQKHVPLLAWFSDSYKEDFGLDTDCLAKLSDAPLSQGQPVPLHARPVAGAYRGLPAVAGHVRQLPAVAGGQR
ncbi:sulfatase-like hydrolase/transferase [Pseudomonas peli]|uniref:sulfatase-like hydrolase/transferase n=1 Tax=Pseudomonas peli TaxID=592361 RepID=UPI003D15DC89